MKENWLGLKVRRVDEEKEEGYKEHMPFLFETFMGWTLKKHQFYFCSFFFYKIFKNITNFFFSFLLFY